MRATIYSIPFLTTLLISFPIVHAQIGYDSRTNHFLCPSPDTHYCAGGSLQGSSVMSCTAEGTAEVRSCNDELSVILPMGYEKAAICYESSQSGDAVCAFNGTGYTFSGGRVDVPETVLCESIPIPFIPQSTEYADGKENFETKSGIFAREDPLNPSAPVLSPTRFTDLDIASQSVPTPSTVQDKAEGLGAGEGDRAICSNPWTTVGAKTKDGDTLTLNIVLVFPTPGIPTSYISSPTGAQSQNPPDTRLFEQTAGVSAQVIMSTGGGGRFSEAVAPTPVMMTAFSMSVTSSGSVGGGSSPSRNGNGVLETKLSNGVGAKGLSGERACRLFLFLLAVCVCFVRSL